MAVRDRESGIDYVARGFWFALGFTPAFLLLSWLAFQAWTQYQFYRVAHSLEQSSAQLELDHLRRDRDSLRQQLQQAQKKPVATIAPSTSSSNVQRERECSNLVLQFSQTGDQKVKERMLQICD